MRWKRSTGDYVESHCGRWWITPIYGGRTRPERYDLRLDNRVVGGGANQRECKEDAERLRAHHEASPVSTTPKERTKDMPAKTKTKTKKQRPSGVTVTRTKSGGFRMKTYGPNAPDLRTVVPGLLGAKLPSSADDEECRTCLGNGRIRDGETRELRRCLDCGGMGVAS